MPDRSTLASDQLVEKLRARTSRVGVIGLGYVGLPLACRLAKAGFSVQGIEENPLRVARLEAGEDYVRPEDSPQLAELVKSGRLAASSDYELLAACDVVIICVPTPLNRNREPDVSFVTNATRQTARRLRPGQLIVLESTTFPGTTEEVMLPILQEHGLQVGRDFLLAYSPERVDPGNPVYHTANTPKIVAGVTERCSEAALALYSQVVTTVYPASSPRVAELVKLHENIFRCVNIALVNELALLCRHMRIDVWEVVRLATTKPYGFMPFLPGPGMGGHCIPIDPFYLTWKAREFDFQTKFIELAGEINMQMPAHVVQLVIDALGMHRKSLRGARVLVLGAAYKANVPDYRESPALRILELLERRGAEVAYNDDLIPEVPVAGQLYRSVPLAPADYDCVVVVTAHSYYDFARIVEESQLVVDTRNATGVRGNDKVWVL